jgi:hypothetical protein
MALPDEAHLGDPGHIADHILLTAAIAAKLDIASVVPSKILQVVTGSTVTQLSSTSATYVDSNLTATITPTKATSAILVIVAQNLFVDGAGDSVVAIQLLRGATQVVESPRFAACNNTSGTVNITATHVLTALDSPASTSALVYKTQLKKSSGTPAFIAQVSSSRSSIILMEVAS